jgi:CheY-like chemotaxis protein
MKTEKRNSRKGSVLVVDDEEIMREVLETLLTDEAIESISPRPVKKVSRLTAVVPTMLSCSMFQCPASADCARSKNF